MAMTITLEDDVVRALQERAQPLLDDWSSVIRRLLKTSPPERAGETRPMGEDDRPPRARLRSDGEAWPAGLILRAKYRGRRFTAETTADGIQWSGKTYSSPSAAARAMKESAGASARTSHTNGWNFFEYEDPRTGVTGQLDDLRTNGLSTVATGSAAFADVLRRRASDFASGLSEEVHKVDLDEIDRMKREGRDDRR